MIEFITLLLGLSRGIQPVQVAVTGPVTTVILELDGQVAGRRDGPPWVFELDLGPDLLPRRLEAVAFDASGHELGRARQFVNYHRRNEDATIYLEESASAPATRGRVVSRSFRGRQPKNVEVLFDDVAIAVADDGTFTLPAHDLTLPHHLLAIVRFGGDEPLRRDLVFGGLYGERVTSALTAVPVVVAGGRTLPPPAELTGWLEARGEPLRVLTVEKPGEVVTIVRDRDALAQLGRVDRELRRERLRLPAVLGPKTEAFFVRTHAVPEEPHIFQSLRAAALVASLGRPLARAARPRVELPSDDRFRSPRAFTPEAPPVYEDLRSLVWLNTKISDKKPLQRLSEALAVAGQLASSFERPRAVLLIVAEEPEDHSQLGLGSVRRFLAALRVPAVVWAPAPQSLARLDPGGGEGLYFGAEGLVAAFEAMATSLETQHVVWVEGDPLPNEIRRGPAAPEWLSLAE